MNLPMILQKIKTFVAVHRVTSLLIAAVLIGAGYWGYTKLTSTAGETRYVVATVAKETIVSSVNGTGQVLSSTQVDLKPKVSGDIVYIGAQNGDTVKAGALLLQIDATNAQKTVRDASTVLESAKLSYQKLVQPADTLSLIQAENALAQAKANLDKSYDDGFNAVSDSFLDLPTTISGLYDVLYGTTVNRGQDNISAYNDLAYGYDPNVVQFKNDAAQKYASARAAYDKNLLDYRMATRTAGTDATEALIVETYDTMRTAADALKSSSDLLNFVKDRLVEHNRTLPSQLSVHQNLLNTYIGQANSHLGSLLTGKNSIVTYKYSIAEKTESLAKLKSGADPLDIDSQKLAVRQKENALADAEAELANYFVRASFDGTLTKLNIKKGEAASSGAVLGTLITRQKLAQISLNEVDVAKIKLGQKANITFDAVSGLTISGEVVEIDAIGTVAQGVVTYNVKIVFDTQDERVKAGMSVSAAVITDVKQDVLAVPNSAVKSTGGTYYVEVFDPPLAVSGGNQGTPSKISPIRMPVTIGVANDALTEIVSGMKGGEQAVVRTITTTATAATAPSLFGAARGGGR